MNALHPALLVLGVCSNIAWAGPQVVCHYNYGGEDRVVRATAETDVYAGKPIEIGSYFLFRPVFDATPGYTAIKLYTYVNRDEGPALIHQASYAYPQETVSHGTHGFTGLQKVYEPVRDSELIYWCTLENQ